MTRWITFIALLLVSISVNAADPQKKLDDLFKPETEPLPAGLLVPACEQPLPPWCLDNAAIDTVDGASGPSAGSIVFTGLGIYENSPKPDLSVINPTGVSVSFQRSYRTNLAAQGYCAPGLTQGWTHNYDMRIVGSSNAGWEKLTMIHYNGAKEELVPELKDGAPTGKFSVPKGADYIVTGQPGASIGVWNWLFVHHRDQTDWLFGAEAKNANAYRVRKITDGLGQPVIVYYDDANRVKEVTQYDNTKLLSFTYDSDGHLSAATQHHNNGKACDTVSYAYGSSAGTTCLLGSSIINSPKEARWAYAYATIGGKPFLVAVGAPGPEKGKLAVKRIDYDANGRVRLMTDANGNQHCYKYGDHMTWVQIKDPQGKIAMEYIQKLGGSRL